jgi:hypothetical protein
MIIVDRRSSNAALLVERISTDHSLCGLVDGGPNTGAQNTCGGLPLIGP